MRRRLTDVEALMWGLEHHPMLASTMGSILVLAGTPDIERFRTAVAHAVVDIESLHHRVSAPPLPLADLEWEPDPDFDLDHHVRVLRLPARSSIAAMTDLATHLVDDPFDRSRPPWSMTLLTGLPRGQAALVVKVHHAIADGQGMLSLGANLFEFASETPPKPAIDLANALAARSGEEPSAKDATADAIRTRVERLFGLAVDAIGTLGSPSRASTFASDVAATAQILGAGTANEVSASTLWQRRSRNRRSLHLCAALPDLRAQAAERGCSVNDLFVAASAEAVLGYHQSFGIELDHVSTSVVVSTRTDEHPDAHNAVIPCGIVVPGVGASTEERLAAITAQVTARRSVIADHQRSIDTASQLAGFLPHAIAAAAALDQGRKLDFATSNLPGPPVPLWLAGEAVEWISPIGPLGGTAFNITMLTYLDDAALGVHYDPSAVTDARLLAAELRSCLARLHVDCRSRSPRIR